MSTPSKARYDDAKEKVADRVAIVAGRRTPQDRCRRRLPAPGLRQGQGIRRPRPPPSRDSATGAAPPPLKKTRRRRRRHGSSNSRSAPPPLEALSEPPTPEGLAVARSVAKETGEIRIHGWQALRRYSLKETEDPLARRP